jgi:WD40 repeat protein
MQAVATAVSKDGRFLFAGGGGTIRVWDAGTRAELRAIQAFHPEQRLSNYGEIKTLAVSQDGNRIFTFGYDCTEQSRPPALRVFSTATGEELFHFPEPPGAVTSLAISPDDRWLAAAAGTEVCIWDAGTGAVVRRWSVPGGRVGWVAYHPGGRELATAGGDGVARTWDVETGRELLQFKTQTGTLYSVAYHPDGSRLASGGGDGTVQVWDLEGGHEALTLRGHSGMAAGLVFSPNGHRLAAMTENGAVTVWDATPRTPRPLTPP